MKKKEYMEKWEKSRQWLHKYTCDKECDNISKYIYDITDQIHKDNIASKQITSFMKLDIKVKYLLLKK